MTKTSLFRHARRRVSGVFGLIYPRPFSHECIPSFLFVSAISPFTHPHTHSYPPSHLPSAHHRSPHAHSTSHTIPCTHVPYPHARVSQVELTQGYLLSAGIYAATFSSALASLVGAPRILQSVAQDNLLPFLSYFAKMEASSIARLLKRVTSCICNTPIVPGKEDEGLEKGPIRGYFLVWLIAACCVMIGELNLIAPLISMFFMLTYALVNLSCFELSTSEAPGWRPAFKYYNKYTAIAGFICCIVCMFLTDMYYALGSCIIGVILYRYIKYVDPDVNWGSAIEAKNEMNVIESILKLKDVPANIKNFRPNYLIFTKDPNPDTSHMIKFGTTLRHGYGVTIYGHIVVGDPSQDYIVRRFNDQHPSTWNYIAGVDDDILKCFTSTDGYGAAALKALDDFDKDHIGIDVADDDKKKKKKKKAVLKRQGTGYFSRESIEMDDLGEAAASSHTIDMSQQQDSTSGASDDESEVSSDSEVESKDSYLRKKEAFLDHILAPSYREGCRSMMMLSGIGNLKPNTIMQGFPENWQDKSPAMIDDWVNTIGDCFKWKKGCMVVRKTEQIDWTELPEGNIDVWWLLDDGGLIVLIAHILKKHKYWQVINERRHVRLYIVSSSKKFARKDKKMVTALLASFRFFWQVHSVVLNDEVREETRIIYNKVICANGANKFEDQNEYTASRTDRYLRISEAISVKSRAAKLVLITIPIPRANVQSADYMTWLEALTRNLHCPSILMRGSGVNVLTHRSE